MTTPTENSDSTTVDQKTLPTAIVSNKRGLWQSKFWILTVLALLLATGLAWWTMPKPGTQISIHFPDGHGLHEGDPVRYRGINVGTVRDIHLGGEDGVDVDVMMDQSAAKRLLTNGARFWIVRPQLALTGVSGLETAVGPKYIAVEPDSLTLESMPCEFEGLAEPPQRSGERRGTEIVFQADEQFGVNPGSAVTYRGFAVGKILDVRLSDDARHVNFQAVINHPHERLVTSKSRFWANSGIDVDFSLRDGLSLDTDSLETIARGGVSFLTVGDGGTEVTPGQVFALNKQPKDEWLEQANKIRLPTVDLKGAVTLVIETTRFGLLGNREVTRLANAIPVKMNSGQNGLVIPRNILTDFGSETPSAKSISVDGFSDEQFAKRLFEDLVALAASEQASESTVPILLLPIEGSVRLPWQELSAVGIENQPLIAVRRPVGAPSGLFVHHPISREQIALDRENVWRVSSFSGGQDLWNGSPILSADSGELIGMMVSDGRATEIISLSHVLDR